MSEEDKIGGKDTGIRIKHYKAAEGSRGNKELITEMVVRDSVSFKFLSRMEDRRLGKACQLNLDMRERVTAECKRYRYQGRLFYMDDESLQVYKKLMNESGGVFTVRVYEGVINAEHTIRAQKRAQLEIQNRKQEKLQALADAQKNKVVGALPSKKERQVVYHPERVAFGYYFKRQEGRLKYATKIQIHSPVGSVSANTKDISPSGLFVVIPEFFMIEDGVQITVDFVRLKEESTHVNLSRVPFKILSREEKEDKTYLKMVLAQNYADEQEFKLFMKSIIKKHSIKDKFCVEDDYDTQLATLLEKMYCDNMPSLPLFIGNCKRGIYLQLLGRSLGNAHLMHFFRREDGFDMSPITLPHRLQAIISEPEVVIAMHRNEESPVFKIISLSNLECENAAQWDQFVRYTLTQTEYRFLKIFGLTEVFPDPESRKLKAFYQEFGQKSAEQLQNLLQRVQELSAFAFAVDVTAQMEMRYHSQIFDTAIPELNEMCFWYGRKWQAQGKTKDNSDKLIKPHFAELAYRESRAEERYIVEINVEIELAGEKLAGKSKDLSVSGLRVEIPEVRYDLEVNSDTRVGMATLQKKRGNINLSTIPYRVVKVLTDEKNQLTTLMLFRVPQTRDAEVSIFFQDLITTNQHKLALCTHDWHSEILSRTYESICGENIQTIPLFMARDNAGSIVFNLYAIPDKVGELAQFFSTAKHGFDLSCLNRPSVTATIFQRVVEINRAAEGELFRPEPCEMIYYLSKDYDEVLETVFFNAKAECEFNTAIEESEYRDNLRKSGKAYRWVKLTATYASPLRPSEIDEAVEFVKRNDKTRSFQLRELIFNVIGVAELTDITDIMQAKERPPEQPAEAADNP